MSSLYIPTIVTLLILTLLPFSIPTSILDVDGQNVTNGGSYYVLSTSYGIATGTGLTYTQINNQCPLYITSGDVETSGTPIKFSSPVKAPYISPGDPAVIAFDIDSSGTIPCQGSSLTWKISQDPYSRQTYITTGGGGGDSVMANRGWNRDFTIVKRWSSSQTYVLQSCNSSYYCHGIGFLNNGILGFTRYPSNIYFKKVSNDLKISTS